MMQLHKKVSEYQRSRKALQRYKELVKIFYAVMMVSSKSFVILLVISWHALALISSEAWLP
jgi:hypothetical protein